LRLMSNKVTYDYFLKFSYFIFLRNRFFQLCKKLQSLIKKTQGILGVNYINVEHCRFCKGRVAYHV
jgi:hypothetical protein